MSERTSAPSSTGARSKAAVSGLDALGAATPGCGRPDAGAVERRSVEGGPLERGPVDVGPLRAGPLGGGVLRPGPGAGRRELGDGLVGPTTGHRPARSGGRSGSGGNQRADRLGSQLEHRAGQGDRRGDPGAGRGRRAPRGSRAAWRAGRRRGSPAACETARSTSGGSASRAFAAARSASSMPTPQSSTVSSCPRPPRGSRRPRIVTAMSGGENRTAFSVSSASRWVRSVTDAPSTSGPSGDLERRPGPGPRSRRWPPGRRRAARPAASTRAAASRRRAPGGSRRCAAPAW